MNCIGFLITKQQASGQCVFFDELKLLLSRNNQKKHLKYTWTLLGLRTSKLALVLREVVARGPENCTEFWTVKFSESILCEISSTLTSGNLPWESSGNKPENDVYLKNEMHNPNVSSQINLHGVLDSKLIFLHKIHQHVSKKDWKPRK